MANIAQVGVVHQDHLDGSLVLHYGAHIQGDDAELTELCVPGPSGERKTELTKKTSFKFMRPVTELTADVILNPGEFYEYRVTRK